MEKSNHLAVLILAAGTSSRLGSPKQLVKHQGKTLLWHACSKALSLTNNVFVVLGAMHKQCQNEIKDLTVNIILNEEYKEGLATSITRGISELKDFEKVLIMLCDQPFISIGHLQKLVDESVVEDEIISSFYKDDVAVPAIFPKVFYKQLLSLHGDKGAKAVIKQNKHKYIILEEQQSLDIDTKDDVEKLIKSSAVQDKK